MADDRDALIATLTEEGWTRIDRVVGAARNGAVEVWLDIDLNHEGPEIFTPTWCSQYTPDTPNAVILAAARAAVEAEGGDR